MNEQKTHTGRAIVIGLGTIMVLGGMMYALVSNPTPVEDPTQVATVPTEAATVTPTKPEDAGTVAAAESETVIRHQGETGKTVMELLKENEEVTTKESSFGEYVDTINGIVGGTDSKYWLYYVNDEVATVGATEYETQDGDVIEWRFE